MSDADTPVANLTFTASGWSQLYDLDRRYNLHAPAVPAATPAYRYNFRHCREKYLYSPTTKRWYYLLPNGDFFQFTGKLALSTPRSLKGVWLANVGTVVYRNPALLYNAQAAPIYGVQSALYQRYDLDWRYNLHAPVLPAGTPAYNYNFRHRREKYLYSPTTKRWYYLLSNGDFFQFTGKLAASTPRSLTGVWLANVGTAVYKNPALLCNAKPVIRYTFQQFADGTPPTLEITTPPSYASAFFVTVTVSDGTNTSTQGFKVTVTAQRRAVPSRRPREEVPCPRAAFRRRPECSELERLPHWPMFACQHSPSNCPVGESTATSLMNWLPGSTERENEATRARLGTNGLRGHRVH